MPYLIAILIILLILILIIWVKSNKAPKKALTLDSFNRLLSTETPEILAESFLDLWSGLDQEAKSELKRQTLHYGWEAYFLTDLNGRDRKKKLIALEVLGCLGGDKSFWPLMNALASGDDELSFSGTAALVNLEAPSQLKNLVFAFREPKKWPPARVAEILLSKGSAIVPLLKRELSEGNEESKRLVIELISEMELQGGEKFVLSDW